MSRGQLERQNVVGSPAPVCSKLLRRAKPLTAAFRIRAPTQALSPELPLQASRPTVANLPAGCVQAAPPLSCPPARSCVLIRLPPSPLFPSFMAGIWKPFLFIHCTRMLPRAVLQRTESSESLQGHFRGCMRSSQLFAGSVWARYISLEAAWPSVHMGHPGLSASQGWRWSEFCQRLGGCFVSRCFSFLLTVLR